MGKKYYSEATRAAHESAQNLFEIGAITEAEMKKFDEMCFVEEPETARKTASPPRIQPQSHVPA